MMNSNHPQQENKHILDLDMLSPKTFWISLLITNELK